MSTLLLRLAAPLQSWGGGSKFEIRATEPLPTKSGVVGLLAAALGLRRDADLSALTALRFGVRADRGGEVVSDFHTAHGKKSYITMRYYLSDAVFLVGLEGADEQLQELAVALQSPRYPLFLGRRSCPPTLPIVWGIRPLSLENALKSEPSICGRHDRAMRVQVETNDSDAGVVQDLPISFNPYRRIHEYRKVKEWFVSADSSQTAHDAMAELR